MCLNLRKRDGVEGAYRKTNYKIKMDRVITIFMYILRIMLFNRTWCGYIYMYDKSPLSHNMNMWGGQGCF